jgi:hypothetical protein
MVMGSTQPLTEVSTRFFSEGKWRLAREVDNLANISEPSV